MVDDAKGCPFVFAVVDARGYGSGCHVALSKRRSGRQRVVGRLLVP
jgi:hypothetical protein